MQFDFSQIFSVVLLILGFGFVIFWHELGHFLAAKWAGVKVEQFAVGFGTAIFSWRKGLGFTWGSSAKRVEQINLAEKEGVNRVDPKSIGETEYRLNWLPLGGYVKMLGQDDMNPNAQVNDPRAYNMRPIPKRMVIVSAGVIMNIILAAVGFFILFLIGFKVQPAIVGVVVPGSPAQDAGVIVGDKIISMDGKPQLDWTKVPLNVALLPDAQDVTLVVDRPSDNQQHTLTIHASRAGNESHGMLSLGISPTPELRGPDPAKLPKGEEYDPKTDPITYKQIGAGDEIVAVEGQRVDPKMDYWKLDRAIQHASGKQVVITVKRQDGKTEDATVVSNFLEPFGKDQIDFAGMIPRARVSFLAEGSLVKDKLLPGDVIASLRVIKANDRIDNPTRKDITELVNKAGEQDDTVEFTVLRDGKTLPIEPVNPHFKTESKRLGVGIGIVCDADHAVIGGIQKDSAADVAGVPRGATIVSINNQPVIDWFDVHKILRNGKPDAAVELVARLADSDATKTYSLKPTAVESKAIAAMLFEPELRLRELIIPRKTTNPIEAAAWGAGETRDLIVQFYITLKRMVQRSVPASNLMGPVGIATVGAKFANRGTDWLIWFLSMISANLAVVNFLPIPIVDGGLFLFLIIEKLQGKPLSERTQSIAQVVGLALILSVFIFVTYQDLTR